MNFFDGISKAVCSAFGGFAQTPAPSGSRTRTRSDPADAAFLAADLASEPDKKASRDDGDDGGSVVSAATTTSCSSTTSSNGLGPAMLQAAANGRLRTKAGNDELDCERLKAELETTTRSHLEIQLAMQSKIDRLELNLARQAEAKLEQIKSDHGARRLQCPRLK